MYFLSLVGFAFIFMLAITYKYIEKIHLAVVFMGLFLLMGFRYGFGNDYHHYREAFYQIIEKGDKSVFRGHFEVGWVLLCLAFSPVGFDGLVIFLSALHYYVVFRLLAENVDREYWWLSLFIFFFNPYFLATQASAMRQTLAIDIFLLSYKTLLNNRFGFFLSMIFASFFHTSALLLIPLALSFRKSEQYSSKSISRGLILFAGLMLFSLALRGLIRSIAQSFILIRRYSYYLGNEDVNPSIGLLINMILMLLLLIGRTKSNKTTAQLYSISLYTYYIIPFSYTAVMIDRLGMYFSIYLIVVLPHAIATLGKARYLVLVAVIVYYLNMYFQFINNPMYSSFFSEYKMFLFH